MGRRGPPPKPTRLAELQGNPGKRPLNRREPKPEGEIGSVPKWFCAEAKAEWRRILPELKRLTLATILDRAALSAYCLAWAELVDATQMLEQEGRYLQVPVVGTKRHGKGVSEPVILGYTQKQHPAVKLQRDAFTRVKQFLAEFGLTPASRSRLEVGDVEEEAADPLQELLRRNAASKN